ncbi:MAG: F0F1 ATP synthase subunit A [Myxococcota bacterium]
MIFYEIEHYLNVPWVIQAAVIAGVLLVLGGVMVRRRLATPDGGVVPDEGISVRNVLEVLVEWLAGLARERMGSDWRKYFPLVGTMFFFILISNLMGLVPGLAGSTSDVNTTAAWAVIAWVFYTGIGIAKHKQRYLVKFMGPSFFEKEIFGRHVHFRLLLPLFLPLELVLDAARMVVPKRVAAAHLGE